jgi:hypothetical protein
MDLTLVDEFRCRPHGSSSDIAPWTASLNLDLPGFPVAPASRHRCHNSENPIHSGAFCGLSIALDAARHRHRNRAIHSKMAALEIHCSRLVSIRLTISHKYPFRDGMAVSLGMENSPICFVWAVDESQSVLG